MQGWGNSSEQALDPGHLETAWRLNDLAELLHNLAYLHHKEGNLEARPLYERALAIAEKLGPEHADIGTYTYNFARALHDQGDLAAARPLYERALYPKRRSTPSILTRRHS